MGGPGVSRLHTKSKLGGAKLKIPGTLITHTFSSNKYLSKKTHLDSKFEDKFNQGGSVVCKQELVNFQFFTI